MPESKIDNLPGAISSSRDRLVGPKNSTAPNDSRPLPVGRPAAMLMEEFPHLADNLLSALTPFRPVAVDDLDVLTGALSDIGRAVRDEIITPAESDALVRAVIQRFAGRKVIEAVASAMSPARA